MAQYNARIYHHISEKHKCIRMPLLNIRKWAYGATIRVGSVNLYLL